MGKKFLWSLLAFFLLSCTSNDDFIESKVDQYIKSQTSFVLVDTLSVNLSTVLIDSIETSSTENLLVGRYSDSELGKVSASTYFELNLPGNTTLEDEEAYDSLVLVMNYSDLVYGDTIPPQTLKVYRLSEEIEPDDQGLVYNTSSFKYYETPIGEITYVPKPLKSDSVVIRLDDSIGRDLFEKMQGKNDEVTSAEDFKKYFKGLVMVPGEQNTAVLSFLPDSASCLSVRTHLPGLTRKEKQYNFSLKATGTYFNHVENDRGGTPLEFLKTQRAALSSAQSVDKAFIEAGAGLVMRIDFPSIKRLLEFDTKNIMYKAELVLRVYPGSQKEMAPPKQLIMYYTDPYNNLITEVQNTSSETIYSSYYSDEIYNEYNYYTLDLTQFLSDELSDGYVDEDTGLLVSLPESEFKSSLNRLVTDARSGPEYRPVLNIYYAFVE